MHLLKDIKGVPKSQTAKQAIQLRNSLAIWTGVSQRMKYKWPTHMKKCSGSLIFRTIQITKLHFTPFRMAVNQKEKNQLLVRMDVKKACKLIYPF